MGVKIGTQLSKHEGYIFYVLKQNYFTKPNQTGVPSVGKIHTSTHSVANTSPMLKMDPKYLNLLNLKERKYSH